jgi:hypothetical protein
MAGQIGTERGSIPAQAHVAAAERSESGQGAPRVLALLGRALATIRANARQHQKSDGLATLPSAADLADVFHNVPQWLLSEPTYLPGWGSVDPETVMLRQIAYACAQRDGCLDWLRRWETFADINVSTLVATEPADVDPS